MTNANETPVNIDSTLALSKRQQLVLAEAQSLLLGTFALSTPDAAPVTGRTAGCVLETEKGDLFVGRNRETLDPVGFFHAEANTYELLQERVGGAAIKGVYMAGSDPRLTGQQLRNITPCSDCYGLLSPNLAADANLVLFEPNTLGRATVFSPQEYRPAYGKWPASEIVATKRADIVKELEEKTPLTEQDREVVADLRMLGLGNDIEFYLTGSSSGRGWMSTALHERLGTRYGDMDIIAVTKDHNIDKVRDLVADIVRTHHGDVDTKTIEADYWVVCGKDRGKQRHVVYDSLFQDDRKLMDLSWGKSLKAAMLRDDYYKNNCYHKIS